MALINLKNIYFKTQRNKFSYYTSYYTSYYFTISLLGHPQVAPLQTAKTLLITSHLEIFPPLGSSTNQRFIPPQLKDSFYKNVIIHPPQKTSFWLQSLLLYHFSFNFILFVHTDHANLDFDWFQYLQKVNYNFKNGSKWSTQ